MTAPAPTSVSLPTSVTEAATWALQDLGVGDAPMATLHLAHWLTAHAAARDQLACHYLGLGYGGVGYSSGPGSEPGA
eukprot:4718978-Alexandrium_andersonii.AAC.1